MVTQRIANPYDQHTLHSKVPVKESIILQSNLQAISWDTPGTPGVVKLFLSLTRNHKPRRSCVAPSSLSSSKSFSPRRPSPSPFKVGPVFVPRILSSLRPDTP